MNEDFPDYVDISQSALARLEATFKAPQYIKNKQKRRSVTSTKLHQKQLQQQPMQRHTIHRQDKWGGEEEEDWVGSSPKCKWLYLFSG